MNGEQYTAMSKFNQLCFNRLQMFETANEFGNFEMCTYTDLYNSIKSCKLN